VLPDQHVHHRVPEVEAELRRDVARRLLRGEAVHGHLDEAHAHPAVGAHGDLEALLRGAARDEDLEHVARPYPVLRHAIDGGEGAVLGGWRR